MDALTLNRRGVQKANQCDFTGAIQAWHQALSLDPNHVGSHINLGQLCFQSECYQDAIQHYSHAIQVDATLVSAYHGRGKVYQQVGSYAAAIRDYTQVLAIASESIEIYNERGIAYAELGNYQAAIADFNQLLQIQPDRADTYFNRGKSQYLAGQIQEAIADLQHSLQLEPNDDEIYMLLGRIYQENAEIYHATQAYLKAAHCHQSKETSVISAITKAVELQQCGSQTCLVLQHSDWMLALSAFQQTLNQVVLESYGKSVYEFLLNGNREAALQFFQQTVDLTSKSVIEELRGLGRLLNCTGFAYHQLGQLDEAQQTYDLAVMIHSELLDPVHPDAAIALFNTGRLFQAQDDLQTAWIYLTQALTLWKQYINPETSGYIHHIANCLHACGEVFARRGCFNEARQNFEQALELRKTIFQSKGAIVGDSFLSLAESYTVKNRSTAKRYFRQALQAYEADLSAEHPTLQRLTQLLAEMNQSSRNDGLNGLFNRLHNALK
jgi:tetratricopeptide (TPR) repeat protein